MSGSYSRSGSGRFLHQPKANQTQKRASKRVYVNVLFRPIAKIRLNWGYFETEPDTGLFSGWEKVIGGHIGPELGGSHYRRIRPPGGKLRGA